MNGLIKEIGRLRRTEVRGCIDARLKEFRKARDKGSRTWFLELCFCILAANTSSLMAQRVIHELGYDGIVGCKSEGALRRRLRSVSCRFYRRRAHFIFLALLHRTTLKKTLLPLSHDERRTWLAANIKGIGYKEASHFLRNIGFFDFAILDKHVLRLLHENGLIAKVPTSLTPKGYLAYEKILARLARRVRMEQGALDMYLWFLKTGAVEK